MSASRSARIRSLLAVMASCVVLLGFAPAASATPIGQDWVEQTPALAREWDGIAYGNGLFAAVSANTFNGSATTSAIMTSPDGITWTERTNPSPTRYFRDITYGNGMFVAVGTAGQSLWSTDGITWNASTLANITKNYYAVSFGAGTFVAVGGNGGAIATSTNGVTWTEPVSSTITTSNLRGVAYGNGTWVAVGSDVGTPQVLTSPDGGTWTGQTAASALTWYDLAFAQGLFVAVATGGANPVMTSTDGITWTSRTAPASPQWRGVAYGNGTWVAVAGTLDGASVGATMRSSDGITWTQTTPASTSNWRDVTFGGSTFVAVAADGSVMTSIGTPDPDDQSVVIRQALPMNAEGTCTNLDDSAVAYGSGMSGGWQRGWEPWPNEGTGGWACLRGLVNTAGVWAIDNRVV